MDNLITRLIGLSFFAAAAVYFIPLESITLANMGWTLLLCIVGSIIIFIPNDVNVALSETGGKDGS